MISMPCPRIATMAACSGCHAVTTYAGTHTGFEVRAKTSTRKAEFSHRVVARRKDVAPARLARMTSPTERLEQIKVRMAKRD